MYPGGSYRRQSSVSRIVEPVAIVTVDTSSVPARATGMTRSREYVDIEIDYYVGAVKVTPAAGQQWLCIKDRGIWRLESQLSFNTAAGLMKSVEGETRMGSVGPTEIDGSQVNLNAPIRPLATTTSERPSASSVPAGSQIYDTTLNKPIWSDGTSWRDAAGSGV